MVGRDPPTSSDAAVHCVLCIVCKQCAWRVFTTHLCANNFPVVTVAGVAVVVPLGAVWLGVSVNRAGFSCNCDRTKNQDVKTRSNVIVTVEVIFRAAQYIVNLSLLQYQHVV